MLTARSDDCVQQKLVPTFSSDDGVHHVDVSGVLDGFSMTASSFPVTCDPNMETPTARAIIRAKKTLAFEAIESRILRNVAARS